MESQSLATPNSLPSLRFHHSNLQLFLSSLLLFSFWCCFLVILVICCCFFCWFGFLFSLSLFYSVGPYILIFCFDILECFSVVLQVFASTTFGLGEKVGTIEVHHNPWVTSLRSLTTNLPIRKRLGLHPLQTDSLFVMSSEFNFVK